MSDTPSRGLLSSLRHLLSSALEMAQVRLELIDTEIEIEKLRIFDGVLLAVLAMVLVSVGLFLLCGLVIVLCFDHNRPLAILTLSILFLGLGGLLVFLARQNLKNPSGLFHASKTELQLDLAQLESHTPAQSSG